MWVFPVFISLLLIAALIEIAVALYAWRHRLTVGALQLVMFTAASVVWTLAYSLELVSTSLSAKLLWIGVAYLGVAFLPVLYLRFAIAYTCSATWLWPWRGAPWYIIPVITIVLNWTNSAHGLYYQNVTLIYAGPLVLLSATPGLWLWVFVTYGYALLAIGLILFWQASRKASALHRRQITLIAVSTLIPWLANGLHLFGLHPFMPLDITPIALAFSGLAILWGMF
ncbi:MAG: histidine kinase N-terminal 7TM domain-containing protein, partial [Roseiflexaceae bacterium]|nr:histidine kinase N-terminal 7TM domain-containing protein [Roseiflexaceae bacterium]